MVSGKIPCLSSTNVVSYRFWLEKQKSSEPFVFVMYDTKRGAHGRFCPHVSFVNPNAPKNATPRESIETRSIVITRDL